MPADANQPLRPRLVAVAAALLALALAGCGPQERPTGEDVPLPSVKTPGTTTGGGASSADSGDSGGKSGKKSNGHDSGSGGSGGNGGGDGGGGGGGGGGRNRGGGGGSSGGGDSSSGGPGKPDIPAGVKTTRMVTAPAGGELIFDPAVLSAPAGEITIVLKNLSDTEHSIAVAGDDERATASKPAGKDEEARVTIRLARGEYEFYCPLSDHREQGMSGILTVR